MAWSTTLGLYFRVPLLIFTPHTNQKIAIRANVCRIDDISIHLNTVLRIMLLKSIDIIFSNALPYSSQFNYQTMFPKYSEFSKTFMIRTIVCWIDIFNIYLSIGIHCSFELNDGSIRHYLLARLQRCDAVFFFSFLALLLFTEFSDIAYLLVISVMNLIYTKIH